MRGPRECILEQGFAVLERVYDESDCREIQAIFQDAWQRAGRPNTSGRFGFVMHPVLKYAPELARFYARAQVVEALREVLGAAPRLAHSGGLMSDGARPFTDWHYHRSDIGRPEAWDPNRTDRPAGIERVLANSYIDGSNDERGPLLLYPRRVDDVLAPPHTHRTGDWPGQVVVYCPPGSVVIFEQSVWHAARPARAAGFRHLFGGHYQGWNNPAPHREDNGFDGAALQGYKEALPLFRGLVERAECSVS